MSTGMKVIIGVAAGAAVVGAALGIGGLVAFTSLAAPSESESSVVDDSLSGSDGDPATITLPTEVAGLKRFSDVVEPRPMDELREQVLLETAELLGQSRGGAATGVEHYINDDMDMQATVWVVADESPALWSDQEAPSAPKYMNLATPMEWVERIGEVECLIQPITPVIYDEDVEDPEVETRIDSCQLVSEGHTLHLRGNDVSQSQAADILRQVASTLTD